MLSPLTTICQFIPGISLILLLGCSLDTSNNGQVWYTLEEAQEKTADTDKKILLDIYTDSSRVSNLHFENIYSDEAIVKTLSKYYCSVRINADSEDTITFNGEILLKREVPEVLGVTTFPTIVFLSSDGEIISTSGYMESEEFLKILSYVGSDAYLNTEFDMFEEYDN